MLSEGISRQREEEIPFQPQSVTLVHLLILKVEFEFFDSNIILSNIISLNQILIKIVITRCVYLSGFLGER